MPGSLLYKLLQTKSKYPLHSAVRLMREDVVFLYLVENNAEVSFSVYNHSKGQIWSIGRNNHGNTKEQFIYVYL